MVKPFLREEKEIFEMITRPISEIALEIRKDWSKQGKGVNGAAKPYLDAMRDLNKITDKYGLDNGSGIVAYFLANANSWKGDTARRVKVELNAMLKEYYRNDQGSH